MGNTYGSIHIKVENEQQVVQMLFDELAGKPNEYEQLLENEKHLEKHFNVEPCEEWTAFLERMAKEFRPEFFVVIADGWLSLYDGNMSYTDAPKMARRFAKKIKDPIVYTSCFDGDIFVFGLIEKGKTKTSGRACESSEIYGIKEKQAKMEEFYRIAGVPMLDQKMKMPSDVMELEELLTSIMPVPLIVYDENDFKSLAEEYELIEEVSGIRVFKVKYKK